MEGQRKPSFQCFKVLLCKLSRNGQTVIGSPTEVRMGFEL